MNQPAPKAQGLGAMVRAIRKDRGLSLAQVADRLGWSESKVSRLETGKRPLSSEEVSALLAILDVTGPEHAQLMAMARTPDEPAWLETVRRGLPSESVTLASYEAEAERVTDWALGMVPGLLQTMDYTRAYMLADGIPEGEIGARLMARQHRQEILTRVQYTAYIDETVLRRPIGSPLILRNQLRHLLDMSERDTVSIRVVPVRSDAHAGLLGPFLMLEFAATTPIVHVELARSGAFLGDQAETDPYLRTVCRLSSISLDARQSQDLIDQAAREVD
jgi:transcriptional regulator with XRE-family HTH domain